MNWLRKKNCSCDCDELRHVIATQAIALNNNVMQIVMWQGTAKRLGAELERVIAQPEGSDEHLAATWWRDQYEALVEQVQEHLSTYHPGVAAL